MQHGVEIGDARLNFGKQRLAHNSKYHKDDQRGRKNWHANQRQLPVCGQEQRQRGNQQNGSASQLHQSLTNEEADLLNIVGGADHQLSGLVLIVVRKRQALDFVE